MKKRGFIIIILLAFNVNLFSQAFFEDMYNQVSASCNGSFEYIDINNDGYDDVVFSDLYYGVIGYLFNDSILGSFNSYVNIASGVNYPHFKIADINNDTINDIIYSADNTLYWKENDGYGNFLNANIIDNNITTEEIVSGDVNNDGLIDFVLYSPNSSKLSIYLNEGNGSFLKDSISFDVGKIVLIDINNDTYLDITTTLDNQNNIIGWFQNDGMGHFNSFNYINNLGKLSEIHSEDMNNDGFNDLVVVNYNELMSDSGKVYLLLNNGSSNFLPPELLYIGFNTNCITIADFDNDSDLDIIATDIDLNISKGFSFITNDNGFNQITPIYINDISYSFNTFPRKLSHGIINDDNSIDLFYISDIIFWHRNMTEIDFVSSSPDIDICENQQPLFQVNAKYASHSKWQVDTGNGFNNIINTTLYSGIDSANLRIANTHISMNNNKYRCILRNGFDTLITDTAILTVTKSPEIILQTDTSICLNSNLNITPQINYGQSPYTYYWDSQQALLDTTVSPTDTTLYIFKVTDSNNCSSTDSISVNVLHPPDNQLCIVSVDPNISKNKIYWEKIIQTNIESYNVYKEVSYNNYSLLGNVNYDSLPEFIDYTSNPLMYGDKYKITTIDTCGNESKLDNCNYHKTINLFISAYGNTMGLIWDYYEVENSGFIADKYYIFRGSTPYNISLYDSISGSFNSYNDVNINSVYYYIIGVKRDNCSNNQKANSNYYSYSNVKSNQDYIGIESNLSDNYLIIRPNPAKENIQFTISNAQLQNAELTITDITGKIVKTTVIASKAKQSIDVSKLNSGTYFIEIKGKELYRGKFVKQ